MVVNGRCKPATTNENLVADHSRVRLYPKLHSSDKQIKRKLYFSRSSRHVPAVFDSTQLRLEAAVKWMYRCSPAAVESYGPAPRSSPLRLAVVWQLWAERSSTESRSGSKLSKDRSGFYGGKELQHCYDRAPRHAQYFAFTRPVFRCIYWPLLWSNGN